uniref:PS II complex 12 kDa extrinsic protein n=1 Tax=Haptolina ericina TaxID=156174 RepID=A0A6T9Q2C8_9EUKA|mmetsp:Transcript_9613/g.21767  ORF Transcript_9613/g.21767 Transcript_9613/m.21767 type:complete len:162 (+) Transcript_9613:59-544(+)|eukprot:CAMPEP_0181192652 /NCGR_PEP_ID=MMETSP1096-20121128/13399_1 /TAXON_ID=156174 ORGANISM="Chrysochromulina ericina, Strain CCMP281" /NCGR_SAMPLE_ID=MMETSP1096 /ASSEMBLY_ACC=CAM_ASM_000453 /LENGTH=161 /DNA_ID=CAMNT_0023282065 /DNA_START=218 /DNA_END=703 /DNA_ORIENTATION=-
MLSFFVIVGLASAFVPPASLQPVSRVAAPRSDAIVMAPKKSSPTKPVVTNKAKPLSPGSNYPGTKNIQKQQSGFGAFVQKFQLAGGKSKYGMPIFLPNGNVNPAYLAAERKEATTQSQNNRKTAEIKRKGLISSKSFELADYIRKKIGEVGSGQDYYQSGR